MNGPNLNPEQAARELIDGLLAAAGWIIQPQTEMNVFSSLEGRLLSASERAAVRADPAYEPAAQMLERIGAADPGRWSGSTLPAGHDRAGIGAGSPG